ncbi:hypothetical protein DEU39_1596 [Chryseobacterium sp. AG363]|nr:hypothetical protein DEU39_1596 [Chryseobacterium sp. AG363]
MVRNIYKKVFYLISFHFFEMKKQHHYRKMMLLVVFLPQSLMFEIF